ncbi:MAG: aldolase/citrate lyase family protein [Ilumatobacter fluminis]|uniref:HpcH/HpaI aldolase family protein n=1 Tax=Ilumatobacter fluminis TaxID=467091 RepID=UPI0032EB6FED
MSLRQQWAAGDETLGLWIQLPSPITAEIAARQPVAYVCVDTQHGVNDAMSCVATFSAIELAGNVPIARVPWNEPGVIGKTLDAGAHGVIVPMVNTRSQAEAVVDAARYAPAGTRSWGPMMAGLRRPDYQQWAHDNVTVIPMIETVEALDNLDEILECPGVDAVYVGPADLSVSLGLPPGNNDGTPAFDDALGRITDACARHEVVAGIHATGALAARRREQGFRMITIGSDALAVRSGFEVEIAAAAGERAGRSDAMY